MQDPVDQGLRRLAWLPGVLRRQWRRLLPWRERVHVSEDTVHLLLATGVGLVGGLVNVVLFWASELLKFLWFGTGGEATQLAAQLEPWQRLAVPAVGALAAGLILHWSSRIARHRESGHLLEAVVVGDGRLPLRSALSKTLSSIVSITSGGSIGREGPITHLSATLASQGGRLAGWEPYRLRLLVACGAAAGMAAAYNAPIAGAVFAAQIVLGSFSMHLFAPLVVASVVAAMVSRSFFEIDLWYDMPERVELSGVTQLPWFVVLGLLTGTAGAGFLRLLRLATGFFRRWIPPIAGRVALGGLLVGAIAILQPAVWGNGYRPTSQLLHGDLAFHFVAWLVLAKLAATVLTVGSGAVGGVFTPTLFLGAGLGALFGAGLHHSHTALDLPASAFALVGMGSMLAATTHSPLLAMIMVFELSLNHTLIPPLMVACAVATLTARRIHRDTVYTEALSQRGVLLDRDRPEPGSASQQTLGDILRDPVPPVRDAAPFQELADRFLTTAYNHLPVVDSRGCLVGLVALQDLKQHLNAGEDLEGVIAFDVMRPPPPLLTPDQRIVDIVPVLLSSDLRNFPVVNTATERRLIGNVTRTEALGLVTEAIASQSSRS